MAADGTIIIDTEIKTDEFRAGTKELEASARRVADSVSGIGDSTKIALNKQVDAFARQNAAYMAQEQRVDSLRKKVEELGNQKVEAEAYSDIQAQIDQLNHQYEETSKKQEELLDMGFPADSAGVMEYTAEIERLGSAISALEQQQEIMEQNGTAYIDPTSTVQYENALNNLNVAEQRLTASGSSLQTSYDALGLKVEELASKTEPTPSKFQALSKALGGTFQAGKKAAAIIGQLGAAIGKGIGKFTSFIKQNNKNNASMGSSIKKILKYTLGIRSLFVLFNKLRSAIKEGFNNLVQYSDDANKSVSMLKSSFTKMKNSIATAFAPLLSAVAPAIAKVVNLISAAMTKIGMFIAALTGNKSFVQAVDVQEDYAASLDKTASSAKKAAKSLKSYLSPLDEINRYDDNSDSSSDAGAGGYSGVDPKDMFKTVDIESPIKNIAERIRNLVTSEDWAGFGGYIADGINNGIDRIKQLISWDNVGPGITKFCTAIVDTLNSLVDGIDWDNIGETIGSGVNTIVNTFYLLVTGINWKNIGKSIAKGLNGILTSVDAGKLGSLIGAKLMVLPNILYGLITTFDWSMLGTAIANALNGVLSTFDLSLIAGGLAAFINGVSGAIISMVGTFDWEALRAEITNGINTFFYNTDWKQLSSSLSDLFTSLLSTIIDVIETIDWSQIGMAIWDFIAGIDWIGLVWDLFQLIIDTVGSALTALGGVVYGLLSDLWGGIKSLFSSVADWFKGIFEPIIKWFSGILDGLVNMIKGVFSINWKSAWEGVKSILKTVWDGLVDVVKTPINYVIGLINGMLSAIAGGLNGIIRLINKLSFKVPDWVPGIGGKTFGFDLGEVTPPQIPYLATGAVIPPNAPFAAVLGDQKRGTNIETPENLLRQIMREELGKTGNSGGSYTFIGQINRRTLFEEVINEATLRQTVTGRNPFELA